MKKLSIYFIILISVFVMSCTSLTGNSCPHGMDHDIYPNCIYN
jgi:hypothetical protein